MNRSLRRQGVVHAGRGRYVVRCSPFRVESHGREWVVSVDGFGETYTYTTARAAIRAILEAME